MRAPLIGTAVACMALFTACGGQDDGNRSPTAGSPPATPSPTPTAQRPAPWPVPERYETEAAEGYPKGKRLAADIAATALTYPRGASARQVARRIGAASQSRGGLADSIEPAIEPEMASSAQVVYPQLAGVTESSLGAMVLVRQRLEGADGDARSVTRAVDVRLRRNGGPWRLDRIGSVGGDAVRRPDDLSPIARRALENPRITWSDSARWDVYRGGIDEGLLSALDRAAERQRFSVSVLRSGHPREVWETSRPSAHSRGYAADIYAIGGRLVVLQSEVGGAAHELASAFVAGGAAQVGSPWVLPPGGSRSFSDDVHKDHVHVQWTAMP